VSPTLLPRSRRLHADSILRATAGLGGAFSKIHGNKHSFSLQDPSISYPMHDDTVTVPVLLVVTIVVPAVITAAISLLFVPGPTANRSTPKALIWRRKLWEWNAAWMGLGVALFGAFMITEGLKDLAGKPRPFLLAVCQPDLSPESIRRHQVGGLGTSLDSAVPIIVDWRICQQPDQGKLRNAFASWPSGHSSFAWAGMLYLSLFICAKFAVHIPYLLPGSDSNRFISTFDEDYGDHDSLRKNSQSTSASLQLQPPRSQAAAPPVYLLVIAFIPIATAMFIATSRWFDYRHHGFDIISGSLLGIFTAYIGFRMYHLPIQGGSGWAWGARTRDRAFWLGVGRAGYVGEEGWEVARLKPVDPSEDLERGAVAADPRRPQQRDTLNQGPSDTV
jgi:membrane-associated phospholipid phosphatase